MVAYTPSIKRKEEITAEDFFFLQLPGEHFVRELITMCSLPASEDTTIYQSLSSSPPHHIVFTIVCGLRLSDFKRLLLGIIISHHIFLVTDPQCKLQRFNTSALDTIEFKNM